MSSGRGRDGYEDMYKYRVKEWIISLRRIHSILAKLPELVYFTGKTESHNNSKLSNFLITFIT